MTPIVTEQVGPGLGGVVTDVDVDRLIDGSLSAEAGQAVERHGVLVFPKLGLNDDQLVAFSRNLGELVAVASHAIPEITVIGLDPANPLAEYFRGAFEWHIDGATSEDATPCKFGVLSATVVSPGDGGTEFASTYAAFEVLTPEEKARCRQLRVLHTMEASQRRVYPEPTAEQLADWRSRPARELPLVWKQRSGRESLVYGATADHVVGMDPEEGRAFLAGLMEQGTRPDRVFRHEWSVGDVVVWDNRGVIHRAAYYEPTSARELHRTTVKGEEPIR